MAISNREVLQSLLERRIERILSETDSIIGLLFSDSPAIRRVALSYAATKKKEFLPKIQEYCDLLVESSCLNPEDTLEESMNKAETLINDFAANLLETKMNLPPNIIKISLSALLTDSNIIKI